MRVFRSVQVPTDGAHIHVLWVELVDIGDEVVVVIMMVYIYLAFCLYTCNRRRNGYFIQRNEQVHQVSRGESIQIIQCLLLGSFCALSY